MSAPAFLASLLPVLACLSVSVLRAEVPPPPATPAKIVVSGNTSTAIDIKTVKIGQQIPKTYAGTQIHNTPGFEFYVSQHYALKSSRGDTYSTMMLEIAELAYPHWVNLTGTAPPDPDVRMYFVCAKDGKQMIEAMVSDTGMGVAGGYGGGITIYGPSTAYNYQSGTLTYHQRALVIHENLHMLQMLVHGTGGSEDFTYAGEQLVFDAAKKQLTVMCFDKPTINNWTDTGLTELRKNFVPFPKAADSLWSVGGGTGAVYQQFLWRDPDRWLKWCIWRDEYYAGRLNRESNSRVMEDIYGPLDQLNVAWEKWVREKRNSFHFVDWGWEQDGNALAAYAFPWDNHFWSQTDVNYAPREKAGHDPLRMDYPAEPLPPIVGPVKRGVPEPSVGYVMDFARGAGWGGMGLGLEPPRSMCHVVLTDGGMLVIDGKDTGIARKEFPIPQEVKDAAKTDGLRYGVTMQIRQKELEVTVRAGKPGVMKETKAVMPLTDAQRERLVGKNMSIIGLKGFPKITPYIDDARPLRDLTKPAAPNFWRFEGMDRLATLYKAAWRLKGHAPRSLLALQAWMLAAVDKDPATQAGAVQAYEDRILAIARDVQMCAADPQTKALALGDLTGTVIFPSSPAQGDAPDRIAVNFKLIARLRDPVECTLRFALSPNPAGVLPQPQSGALVPWRPKSLGATLKLPVPFEPARLATTVELSWRGQRIAIPFTRTIANTTIPRWTVIGPFPNPGGATADVSQPVETGPIDLAKKHSGIGGQIGWRKVERPAGAPVLAEHIVDFIQLFGQRDNAAAYALTWLDSDKAQDALLTLGSDDGAQVWLNDTQVHKNLVPRGYAPQTDRIPIHLNQGRNKLLVKITQATGPWRFAAHLLAPDGGYLAGVKYAAEK